MNRDFGCCLVTRIFLLVSKCLIYLSFSISRSICCLRFVSFLDELFNWGKIFHCWEFFFNGTVPSFFRCEMLLES